MNKNDNSNPCAKHYSRVTLNLWTISDENKSHKDAIYVLLKSLIGETYEDVRVFDMDVMIDEDKNENN